MRLATLPGPADHISPGRRFRSALRSVLLLVTGMMELATTVGLGVIITVERLTPWPRVATRAVGAVLLAGGALLLNRALGGG
jgi:predicted metal-binding membrane protein